MRRPLSRLFDILSTLVIAAAVFWVVQAWMLRDSPSHWQENGALRWVLADGTLGHGTLRDLRRALGVTDAPVGLYVWATWCPICAAMSDAVDGVAREQTLLTVATRSGEADALQRHLQGHGQRWVVILDPDGRLAQRHGWRSVPVFGVLMPDGALEHVTVGYTTAWGMRWRLWLAKR
ncbi:thioredoxin domain-containing protein [Tepidimonas charontis]|uniref:DsbE: periplasmic protein thiol:disulfide oxidoreductase, DsbE subfamily n=1 Tax=Tepidimonas charontis TaxID=2267262 RepID=A0A554XKR2_9BURK|nr:protein disulfide oxidoreductase [Tepidimonas charontis]TSE36412.1 dsbE: periplasmic protein thiol:disulfide oxidoreductase, DsbE subfamily [Tepidimonas charontis]